MDADYGIVYFIGPKESGPVKIGYTATRDAEKRRAQLQTGSAENYVVLGTIEGGPFVERSIHQLLLPHLVRGEWFERSAALALLGHLNGEMKGWGNNKFGFALADSRSQLEEPDEQMTPQQSLAARVASDIVSDRLRDILSLPIGQPVPLRAWLQRQQDRDDPTGDLAKDMQKDENFPPLGSLEEYLRYITQRMSNPSVTRAVFDAWIECVLAIKGLPFRSDSTPSEGLR